MTKFLASAALALLCALVSPAQAARIDISATVLAPSTDPIVGTIGAITFSTTSLSLIGTGDTADWTDVGGGVFSLAFTGAAVVIDGGPAAAILTPLFGLYDTGTSQFGLSVAPVPPTGGIVLATPFAPLSWDRASDLPPTLVAFYAIDWTTLDGSYLATTIGQLTLDFGPDLDGTGPGMLAASVSDVPLPAAAPLLLGALGLLGMGAARRRT